MLWAVHLNWDPAPAASQPPAAPASPPEAGPDEHVVAATLAGLLTNGLLGPPEHA